MLGVEFQMTERTTVATAVCGTILPTVTLRLAITADHTSTRCYTMVQTPLIEFEEA